ncbi:MAG: hypothetical protein V8T55_02265 [Phocaeicola plebeius]
MMEEIIYKGNKIICFSSNDFEAFIINEDGDIDSKTFITLSAAKKWIDKMDNEKYSERICRIIWHDALQKSIKPLSWGINFSSIKVIDKGTEFNFQTQTVMGQVRIQYSEDTGLFNVTVRLDNNEDSPIIMKDIDLKRLVSLIDKNIKHRVPVEHGVAV